MYVVKQAGASDCGIVHLLKLLQCVMGWILLRCALTSENSDNTLWIVLKTSLSLLFQLPENITEKTCSILSCVQNILRLPITR